MNPTETLRRKDWGPVAKLIERNMNYLLVSYEIRHPKLRRFRSRERAICAAAREKTSAWEVRHIPGIFDGAALLEEKIT